MVIGFLSYLRKAHAWEFEYDLIGFEASQT
jgi:hypothetical protein